MVPFETALVSFYALHSNFSSIFTRFRDIAAFVLQNATFSQSLPHLQSPHNFPMFPWEQVDRLFATRSEGVGALGLIVCAISFQDFGLKFSRCSGWLVKGIGAYRAYMCKHVKNVLQVNITVGHLDWFLQILIDKYCLLKVMFLLARHYAQRGFCHSDVSVHPSVCHSRYCVQQSESRIVKCTSII